MANTDQREIAETVFQRKPKSWPNQWGFEAGARAPRGTDQEPVSLASIALGAGRKTR